MSVRLSAAIPVALAVVLVGCGGASDRSSPEDASAELEALIARQLPREAKRLTGSEGFVRNVGCVHSDGSAYQCIATISSPNAYGRYVTEQLPIDGTCDENECIWKVAP